MGTWAAPGLFFNCPEFKPQALTYPFPSFQTKPFFQAEVPVVTWGQDMVALLLLEVTSTVSTSFLGESWGRWESKDSGPGRGVGGGVWRETSWCMRCPALPQGGIAAGLCNAGLAVNMGATFGNLWLRQKELQTGFLPRNPSHLSAHNTHTLVAENC